MHMLLYVIWSIRYKWNLGPRTTNRAKQNWTFLLMNLVTWYINIQLTHGTYDAFETIIWKKINSITDFRLWSDHSEQTLRTNTAEVFIFSSLERRYLSKYPNHTNHKTKMIILFIFCPIHEINFFFLNLISIFSAQWIVMVFETEPLLSVGAKFHFN